MGEKIFDLLKTFASGKSSKVFWTVVIIICILTLIVFPYIDANFFYYGRIEKRIDNLSSLLALTDKSLEESPELFEEYNNIIQEITNAQEKNITAIIHNSPSNTYEYWIKFASGGLLFSFLGIVCLFQKKKDVQYSFKFFLKNNLFVFIFCIIIALILAFIFSKIPIIGSVWVNAIAAPIIQIIIMCLLFLKPKTQ